MTRTAGWPQQLRSWLELLWTASSSKSLGLVTDAVEELRHIHSTLDQISAKLDKLDKLVAEGRIHRLHWAIQHAHIEKFEYCTFDKNGNLDRSGLTSDLLVKDILQGAIMGFSGTTMSQRYGVNVASAASVAAKEEVFRQKLSRQLHRLTGNKPDFRQNAADAKDYPGRWAVYLNLQ
jgi:hypothetical protein